MMRHVLLVAVTIAFLVPFYWMDVSALKDNSQIFAQPLQWWPNPVRWDNVRRVLHYPGFPFLRFLWNSVFYAGGVSIGTVLSCAAVGYGFARLHFPGRDLLFAITVSTMLIPGIVIFIPTFVLFKHLSLLGTYAPLICPAFLGNAFFIFLLRQFFLGLPQELSDAARVDGAGEFRIFWQIMLPLAMPAIATLAIFSFQAGWNAFLWPLLITTTDDMRTIQLGLTVFVQQYSTQWDQLMAATVVATLPVIVVFGIGQRLLVRGIAFTGIKG